jgi:hypothetical protein
MNNSTRLSFDQIRLSDAELRYAAFQNVLNQTIEPVAWAYEVWDEMLDLLETGDNHQRSIAVQVLANLAKSDPEQRMTADLDKVMTVIKDEKFVTARHALQTMWKIAVANETLSKMVTDRLAERYKNCIYEKNATLIRYDIIQVFRKIYDVLRDETIRQTAVELIEIEEDLKYKKKYNGIWKDLLKATK